MYVMDRPVQFEFQSGYLVAHFSLPNIHAHVTDLSEFIMIGPTGRKEAFIDEGLRRLSLGVEDGIAPYSYFVGHFSATVVDPQAGSSASIRDDDHFVSEIVIEPLLKPLFCETIIGESRPGAHTLIFSNNGNSFGSEIPYWWLIKPRPLLNIIGQSGPGTFALVFNN